MNKLLLITALFFLPKMSLLAQDFDFGVVKQDELNMSSYKNDTSAHAVVLNEYGYTHISQADGLPLSFDYHVKIKILDSKGFEEGNIAIPLRLGDEEIERIEDIAGVTIYRDDKGNVQKAQLDSKNIFTTKDNKYNSTVKFAMPNLRNGCIIEYKYRIMSPFRREFRTWMFQQQDVPKVFSLYEAQIPGIYHYNIVIRGALKLLEEAQYQPKLQKDCFSYYGTKCDCSLFKFAMKDIPAFVEEDHMTSPRNFMSGIYFELSEYYNMSTGGTMKLTTEWKNVDSELRSAYYFGSQVKKKDVFKDVLAPLIAGKTDSLERAKIAYHYIQKNIKWNNVYSRGSWDGIRKAADKRTGNVADINLALVAALNATGVNADAVLISTRNNGIVSKLSPVVDEFDYVIAKTDIGGKTYLLDATDPLLSFGLLPIRCLNDQGRVISLTKPSYWVDASKQTQATTSNLDFVLTEKGKLKGKMVNYSFGYDAYLKRRAIKEFNTTEEYIDDFDEKRPRLKVLNATIDNIDSLNKPLVETYEVELDIFDNLNADKLSLNPFLFKRITVNPFKLEERNYPVDWGMTSTERVVLTVQMPENFTVENPPKNLNIVLPDNGGRFVTSFEAEKNRFVFSHAIMFNKAIYLQNEYPYLKQLYNQIILSEKNDLVFKKN